MSISQNSTLYALLGTTYGGDGVQNFNLPDFRGRVPIGAGKSSASGKVYPLGQMGGAESVTLSSGQMAAHTHTFNVNSQLPVNGDTSTTNQPLNAFPSPSNGNAYSETPSGEFYGNLVVSATIGNAGSGSAPLGLISPVLCLNYIICVEGYFPNRN